MRLEAWGSGLEARGADPGPRASGFAHGPLVLTVDVEDWTDAFSRDGLLPPALAGQPSRLHECLPRLLELLAASGSTATFFVLGRVAREFPALIRALPVAGHRVACHGWAHRVLDGMNPTQLLHELEDARALLEDLCGQPIRGFRAPWFSLTPATSWAGEVIQQAGFAYDSSRFPAGNPWYGDSSAPRGPHRLDCGLLEVPPAVAAVGPLRLPVAGGFYWRVLPGALVRWGIGRLRAEGLPATLYVHPWELDTVRPWVWISPMANLIHYVSLRDPALALREILSTGPARPIETAIPEADSGGTREAPLL